MRLSIVGQKHLGVDPYNVDVLPGAAVTLIREPKNAYDVNAIQVWIDGKHVGYIPKNKNAELARVMDERARLTVGCDEARKKVTMDAKFVRSANSAYPQVEVEL